MKQVIMKQLKDGIGNWFVLGFENQKHYLQLLAFDDSAVTLKNRRGEQSVVDAETITSIRLAEPPQPKKPKTTQFTYWC